MRNLAIAEALVHDDLWHIQKAWFVLCAHEGNPKIVEQWKAWRALLPDPAMAPLLPASRVVDAGERAGYADWGAWMSKRYLLGPDAESPTDSETPNS